MGGLSQGLESQTVNQGIATPQATVKNALLNGAARASIEEGQNVMNETRNARPAIEVKSGTPLYILFDDTH